jgi:plasmid stabilization system protein ParE
VVQVVWTRRALADLTAIQRYIQLYRPFAAQRMAQRLNAAAASLAEHPDRGRMVGRFRELTAIAPYVIR